MIHSGLVSVTFRQLSPTDILELVARARIEGIEWGGDIHVPHGDLARAREVSTLTREHGVKVAAYGSYYKVGSSEAGGLTFQSVLDTALTLGAPSIRVWAGDKGSSESSPDNQADVRDDSMRIADLADKEGVGIAYEWHGGTLTDTLESACELLEAVTNAGLTSLWQPLPGRSNEDHMIEIDQLSKRLSNIHVYHWGDNHGRMPLRDGLEVWRQYLEAAQVDGMERYALLEFVRDDSPEAFLEDAAAMRELVNEL
jgi:3-dehydroshikimate dehydratase